MRLLTNRGGRPAPAVDLASGEEVASGEQASLALGATAGTATAATATTTAILDLADLLLWTTDLSNYLACPHLVSVSLAAEAGVGQRKPEYSDPSTEAEGSHVLADSSRLGKPCR